MCQTVAPHHSNTALRNCARYSSGRDGPQGSRQVALNDDELCELHIDRQLQDTTDLWTKRVAVRVLCLASESGGRIAVTVTTANGQEPLDANDVSDAQSMLESQLKGIVRAKGWNNRYREVTLQVLP